MTPSRRGYIIGSSRTTKKQDQAKSELRLGRPVVTLKTTKKPPSLFQEAVVVAMTFVLVFQFLIFPQ